MKEEREIRFKAKIDLTEITKLMEGVPLNSFYIEDVYFDSENYSFLRSEKGYRWRKIKEKEYYEYKEVREKKIYEKKYESLGSLIEEMIRREKMLFIRKIVIKKKRWEWKKEGVVFVFDQIEGLGNFFEVECESCDPEKELKKINIPKGWLEKEKRGVSEIWFDENIK